MKRLLLLVSVIFATFTLFACTSDEEKQAGFLINEKTGSLGAVDENSLDKTRFSYTFYLTSDTEKLENVKQVSPIIGDSITDKIISNEQPTISLEDNSIEIKGKIVFDTAGLSKEEIIELEPYITAVKILTNDDIEHIVDLVSRK